MSIHLILSSNSVRNTTVRCDSLGIYYEVSESHGIVTVKRWDSPNNASVVVGEFELFTFKKDKIRLGGERGEWGLLQDVLHRNGGALCSIARTFAGNDGKQYRWKTRWGALLMCEDTGERKQPALVTYHRYRLGKQPSFLEVSDSSLLRSLDNIIITFLIMERRRRDREKRRQRAAASGGGGP